MKISREYPFGNICKIIIDQTFKSILRIKLCNVNEDDEVMIAIDEITATVPTRIVGSAVIYPSDVKALFGW